MVCVRTEVLEVAGGMVLWSDGWHSGCAQVTTVRGHMTWPAAVPSAPGWQKREWTLGRGESVSSRDATLATLSPRARAVWALMFWEVGRREDCCVHRKGMGELVCYEPLWTAVGCLQTAVTPSSPVCQSLLSGRCPSELHRSPSVCMEVLTAATRWGQLSWSWVSELRSQQWDQSTV